MIATCHTEGCGNADVPIDVGSLTYTDDEGTVWESTVSCGVCGQPITDLTDSP